MTRTSALVPGIFTALLLAGCGSSGGAPPLDDGQPTVDNYAALVHANYSDALVGAQALKAAIDTFVATPSAATLNAARQAWLASREAYGQTEVYRFYDGPIDGVGGPEGQINAWPLDEVFIDYVVGLPTAGMINSPAMFPTLGKEILAGRNEQGGEKNIATGYHAVEFLLWGQDTTATGPGSRPFTDYVAGVGGTAANQDRRGQYLTSVAELLVDDLQAVTSAWAPAGTNYRSTMVAGDRREAVRRMLLGMGSLSGAELSGERMRTAYDNKDQEDEHSCFSDNTHRDIYNNALGIRNVYVGQYGSIDGPGIDALVAARDAALDAKMKTQLDASLAAVQAIPMPFDQSILGDDTAPGRMAVLSAIQALQAQAETIVEVATLLGIKINLE